MRLVRLLLALPVALLSAFATAQSVSAPHVAEAEATLFYPRTVARAEERSYAGTASWRMIDLGPTRAVEAVLSFPGIAADIIVLIEENPFSDLPDDVLIHAWPQWMAGADGPAVASAYAVGVETPGAAQIGLIGTARGDWTVGLMAAASERNHERLAAASVLIVELGLPDGKAYVGLRLGEEQQRLLAGVVPAAAPAFPLDGPAEQRILPANRPEGTGGVLWDTPGGAESGTVRGRVYLYEIGAGFDVAFAVTPDGLAATVTPLSAGAGELGRLAGVSLLGPDGEVGLNGGLASMADGATRLLFQGEAAQVARARLESGAAALSLSFIGVDGTATPVLVALPQRWNPFTFLPPAP